jgi:hypothetical protein
VVKASEGTVDFVLQQSATFAVVFSERGVAGPAVI